MNLLCQLWSLNETIQVIKISVLIRLVFSLEFLAISHRSLRAFQKFLRSPNCRSSRPSKADTAHCHRTGGLTRRRSKSWTGLIFIVWFKIVSLLQMCKLNWFRNRKGDNLCIKKWQRSRLFITDCHILALCVFKWLLKLSARTLSVVSTQRSASFLGPSSSFFMLLP